MGKKNDFYDNLRQIWQRGQNHIKDSFVLLSRWARSFMITEGFRLVIRHHRRRTQVLTPGRTRWQTLISPLSLSLTDIKQGLKYFKQTTAESVLTSGLKIIFVIYWSACQGLKWSVIRVCTVLTVSSAAPRSALVSLSTLTNSTQLKSHFLL